MRRDALATLIALVMLTGLATGAMLDGEASERPGRLTSDLLSPLTSDLLSPFWSDIMIPVVICLAVVLLTVSIFAVALVTIRSLRDEEPSFVAFAPPGFDAVWERNLHAELGLAHVHAQATGNAVNSPIEEVVTVYSGALGKGSHNQMPVEPPRPAVADNSTDGMFRRPEAQA